MILDQKRAERLIRGFIHNDQWTAVVPAAGKGSRLEYELPKALFPLSGKPLIDWVIDRLSFGVSKIIVVITPSDESLFRQWLIGRADSAKISFAFQTEPKGTVDAILCAEKQVTTPHTVVAWGDHYSIKRKTVQLSLQVHEAVENSSLTLPTCERKNPYIAIQRDSMGRISSVEQARERKTPLEHGENDCGLFAFRSECLFQVLHKATVSRSHRGKLTRELNLLSLFPEFERLGKVNSLRIASIEETMGINTREEASIAESLLTPDGNSTWNPKIAVE